MKRDANKSKTLKDFGGGMKPKRCLLRIMHVFWDGKQHVLHFRVKFSFKKKKKKGTFVDYWDATRARRDKLKEWGNGSVHTHFGLVWLSLCTGH